MFGNIDNDDLVLLDLARILRQCLLYRACKSVKNLALAFCLYTIFILNPLFAIYKRSSYPLIWPLPLTRYLNVVRASRPIGPRTWSFCVDMPISAPSPNSKPSVKRVLAFTYTAAASTSRWNFSALRRYSVTIHSLWPVPKRLI